MSLTNRFLLEVSTTPPTLLKPVKTVALSHAHWNFDLDNRKMNSKTESNDIIKTPHYLHIWSAKHGSSVTLGSLLRPSFGAPNDLTPVNVRPRNGFRTSLLEKLIF